MLFVGLKRWNEPAFILNKSIHAQTGSRLPQKAYASIRLGTPTGKEEVAGFHLAKTSLQACHSGEVIGAPALVGAPVPARGASDEKSPVEIGIVILVIEIKELAGAVVRC